jgi:hypothetical protein
MFEIKNYLKYFSLALECRKTNIVSKTKNIIVSLREDFVTQNLVTNSFCGVAHLEE